MWHAINPIEYRSKRSNTRVSAIGQSVSRHSNYTITPELGQHKLAAFNWLSEWVDPLQKCLVRLINWIVAGVLLRITIRTVELIRASSGGQRRPFISRRPMPPWAWYHIVRLIWRGLRERGLPLVQATRHPRSAGSLESVDGFRG